MRLYKRNSAGGQALHHWQQTGKHTTIHIVYELDQNITAAALTSAIEEKLLVRFPRFRGHVTANEKSWAVPDMSAIVSSDYVEVVNLAPLPEEHAQSVAGLFWRAGEVENRRRCAVWSSSRVVPFVPSCSPRDVLTAAPQQIPAALQIPTTQHSCRNALDHA